MTNTNSVWSKAHPTTADAASLNDDLTTDVCIVGAGIAGLLSAQALSREGHPEKAIAWSCSTGNRPEPGRRG